MWLHAYASLHREVVYVIQVTLILPGLQYFFPSILTLTSVFPLFLFEAVTQYYSGFILSHKQHPELLRSQPVIFP